MFRTNLLRILSLLAATVVTTSIASAQFFTGMGHGQHHAPQFHIPHSTYQAPIIDHYVGQPPKIWDDQQPVEKFLGSIARRSWMRVEYLHWNFQAPGGHAIGADVTGVTGDTVQVFDNLNGGINTGEAIIPTYDWLDLPDAGGVRGTLGVDLNGGALELSFYGTAKKTDSFELTDLQAFRTTGQEAIGTASRPNVITPLMTSGAVTDASAMNALVYDNSFTSEIESRLWGTDVVLLTDPYVPGEGVKWQWLGGFRYINYYERLQNTGTDTDGGTVPLITTRFGGNANNNLYGPEIGARVSAVHRMCTFSVTPRLMFAINDTKSQVMSGPLTDQQLDVTQITENGIDFSSVLQLEFKGEIHVNDHFSLFGGYDFMWISHLSRPDQNIVYDSETGVAGGFATNIGQDVDLKTFYTRGFSFGGVLRY